MIPTIQFMEVNFPKLNARFFDGKLITPKFEIIHKQRVLGEYQPCLDLTVLGNDYQIDVIRMTDVYDVTEHIALEVLCHEMIHLWTHQTEDPSNPGNHLPVDHGKWFKKKAAEINAKSNFHIARTTDGTSLVKVNKKKKTTNAN